MAKPKRASESKHKKRTVTQAQSSPQERALKKKNTAKSSRLPKAWRLLAVKAYYRSNSKMRAAVKRFLKAIPDRKRVPDPEAYISAWVTKLERHHTLLDGDSKNPRGRAISDEDAKRATEVFYWGYREDGYRVTYDSFTQACELNSTLREILKKTGVTTNTLRAAVRRVDPRISFVKYWVDANDPATWP